MRQLVKAQRAQEPAEPREALVVRQETAVGVAPASGHELELEPADAAVALGDELRTLQIGRILVENALRHTPPGTPVRVRALTREGRAVLEVEDEGPGIPAERQEQLFERFFRLEGTRASGSGLGLAIARQLAQLMDGTVTELIIATDPNLEGEATAAYLARLVSPMGLAVSRLASGLPVGGDLEYADEVTLGRAFEGRRALEV